MSEPTAAVVDSNVLGWLLEGRRHPLRDRYRDLIGDRRVIVSLQVAEIRYGMLRARWGELRVRRTERAIAQFSVAQPDDETVFRYASLRSWAAEHGHALAHKVHDGDRWIAATAFRLGQPLLSHDGVFNDAEALDLLTLL